LSYRPDDGGGLLGGARQGNRWYGSPEAVSSRAAWGRYNDVRSTVFPAIHPAPTHARPPDRGPRRP